MIVTKDPSERLDYAFDFKTPVRNPTTGVLGSCLETSETITTPTVTVTLGDVELDGVNEANGIVTAWVKGGTVETPAQVTCHILTSAGREYERTITFQIHQR